MHHHFSGEVTFSLRKSGLATRARRDRCYYVWRYLVAMLAKIKRAFSLSILAFGFIAAPVFAIEVTEPAGAAHGFPGLCDINGKKLADGEFRQWVEDKRLHIVITYKFPDGQVFEENALFRQHPELAQEKWSWRETKNGKLSREFTADFLAKTATALTHENNTPKRWPRSAAGYASRNAKGSCDLRPQC